MFYDFITLGGATEDITVGTKEGILLDNKKDILRQKLIAFEYGAKISVDRSYVNYGGGAANAAVNFAGLGFKTAAIFNLGQDDRGRRIVANLKKRGVDSSLVSKSPKAESAFSFILITKENERMIFSSRGANKNLKLNQKQLSALKKSAWLYITSLNGPFWRANLNQVFKIKNLKIAWNPGHEQLLGGVKAIAPYLKKTKVFCVNKDEAIELVLSLKEYKYKDNKFLNQVKNLLLAIYSLGPRLVVITSGKDGADVYDGERFYHENIIKEQKRLDTTGVGDAFNSSLLAGLVWYKFDIKRAMKLGLRSTASLVSQIGAQNGLLTKKDLKLK